MFDPFTIEGNFGHSWGPEEGGVLFQVVSEDDRVDGRPTVELFREPGGGAPPTRALMLIFTVRDDGTIEILCRP
jgi:hypothetical protein